VGCVLREMHPAKRASAATRKQTKRAAPHPNPLCSTTGVLLVERASWEHVETSQLPTFANKCKLSPTAGENANYCEHWPTSAKFCKPSTFLSRTRSAIALVVKALETDGPERRAAAHALFSAPGERGCFPRRRNYGQSHDRTRGFETAQRQRCVAAEVAAIAARADVPEGWIAGPLPAGGA
jgi:hypothetical protein